tara:strand:+ start:420 stop:932 length:513 start_codon:yes stop_codon:yes gene_type:complete
MKNIFNILGFQLSWWACVLGVKSGLPYLGPVCMLLFLGVHFIYLKSNSLELKLVVTFAVLGTLLDTGLAISGILSYNGLYAQNVILAPLWITAMWGGFCATVNHSLSWLKERWISSFILGAIFGPLSYIAGEKFDAITFHSSLTVTCIALAIIWGISMSSIFLVNKRIGL